MSDFASIFSPVSPDVLRVESRQVVGGNPLDKPTFGEHFKMAMAKVGSFLGRMGAAVGPLFGPFGYAGSIGAYGLQNLSDGAINRMQYKKFYEANLDAQSASTSTAGLWTPGFGPLADSSQSAQAPIQVAPFARGYERGIESTLSNKGGAAVDSINGSQVGSTL